MRTLAGIVVLALLGAVLGGTALAAAAAATDDPDGASFPARWMEMWGFRHREQNGMGPFPGGCDADGDGIPNPQDEDWVAPYWRDADGDGIPNGQDEDYPKPLGEDFVPPYLQDEDGDGIVNGEDDDWTPSRDGLPPGCLA